MMNDDLALIQLAGIQAVRSLLRDLGRHAPADPTRVHQCRGPAADTASPAIAVGADRTAPTFEIVYSRVVEMAHPERLSAKGRAFRIEQGCRFVRGRSTIRCLEYYPGVLPV
jgi:hypothetical protein